MIEEVKEGSLAKNNKLNEVIRYLNSLINMKVRVGDDKDSPSLVVGELASELTTVGGGDDSDSGDNGETSIPFEVTAFGADLSIGAGKYILDNTAADVTDIASTSGTYAYLRVKHSSAGVLDSTDPVTLHVESSTLDEYTLDTGTNSYIENVNILLGEVVSGELIQYRWGNVELVFGFSDGLIHYVPVFSGGSV